MPVENFNLKWYNFVWNFYWNSVLAVHHDFHRLLVATRSLPLLTAKLHSRYVKEPKSKILERSESENFGSEESDLDIYLRFRNPAMSRSPGSHRQEMFCCNPADVLAVKVANIQTGVCKGRDGRMCGSREWRFADVNNLKSCDIYAQPLSLWLLWRLIDQWPFRLLLNKRGKAVLATQDWPS